MLVIAALPGLAAAQVACPAGTARDGVWIEFPDRLVESRVLSDGRIQEMEYLFEEGGIYGYITLPMGLVVESWALQDGRVPADERESVTYSGTPDPVPFPAPGVRFDGIETSRYADGGEMRYSLSAVVGAAQPVGIGACSYTGLPVDVTRVEMGGPAYRDAMMYLVDLGITLYLGFSDDGSDPVPLMPVSISSLPPVAGAVSTPGLLPPPLPTAPGGGAGLPEK
jgi:hypothetical protein